MENAECQYCDWSGPLSDVKKVENANEVGEWVDQFCPKCFEHQIFRANQEEQPSILSPQKRKTLDLALKNCDHPIFARADIEALAEAAFDGEEYLHPYDLSAEEIDHLMSGLNIAREY